ncbi:unnamed protein product [Boreogadus saida]
MPPLPAPLFLVALQLVGLRVVHCGAYYGHKQHPQHHQPMQHVQHMGIGKEGFPLPQFHGKEMPYMQYPHYRKEIPQMPMHMGNENAHKGGGYNGRQDKGQTVPSGAEGMPQAGACWNTGPSRSTGDTWGGQARYAGTAGQAMWKWQEVRVFQASQEPKAILGTKACRACRDYTDPKGTKGWVRRDNRDTRVSLAPEGPPARVGYLASGSRVRTDSQGNTDRQGSLDLWAQKDILGPPEREGSPGHRVYLVMGDQARTACLDSQDP